MQKKKRVAKDLEKEVTEHRGESPLKMRKKSLINFFIKDEEIPITVHELMI